MTRYALGTTVTVAKSLDEVQRLLKAAGTTHYAYADGPEAAFIQFRLGGRHYRFEVRRPVWDELKDRYSQPSRVYQEDALEAEWRRRWRARLLWIKATIEFAEFEPDAFARAFLAHLVLPDGRTFGQWAAPQVEAMYEGGQMPPLLTAGNG